MNVNDARLQAAIAVNSFGLGARPGEIETATKNPRHWLMDQLNPSAGRDFPTDGLQSASANLKAFFSYIQLRGSGNSRKRSRSQGQQQTAQVDPAKQKQFGRSLRDTLRAEITARSLYSAQTSNPFHERLVQFWSNHFTVAARNAPSTMVAGAHEREAIRPHILGTFADLAFFAIFHPAMLVYLDNWQSVGPHSRAGRRAKRGINENLAREVMELHTMGSKSGYTQDDVIEFSKALTGWTIGNPRFGQDRMGEIIFVDLIHEPGNRTIMGKSYGNSGKTQAPAILRDLCAHPATARHVSQQLAAHFVSDTPPGRLVDELERTFLQTGGNLMALYGVLVAAPEMWQMEPKKVKSPNDLLTSTARLMGLSAVFAGRPRQVFESFAQVPFTAPSPEGWPDTAEAWITPDALTKRIEWANRIAEQHPTLDARQMLRDAVGERVSTETVQAVSRAASPAQAIALALLSPDFQRR